MVSLYKIENTNITNDGKYISCELRGLSTDEKPTTFGENEIGNGSVFIEIDTGSVFIYNQDSKEWNEV